MNTFFTKNELINYIFIITGSLILSLALVGFFLPNEIITGGTAGLALLLHYITPLTIGSLIALINLPLLIIGNKYLGKNVCNKNNNHNTYDFFIHRFIFPNYKNRSIYY